MLGAVKGLCKDIEKMVRSNTFEGKIFCLVLKIAKSDRAFAVLPCGFGLVKTAAGTGAERVSEIAWYEDKELGKTKITN